MQVQRHYHQPVSSSLQQTHTQSSVTFVSVYPFFLFLNSVHFSFSAFPRADKDAPTSLLVGL